MARATGKKVIFDIRPAIDYMGLDRVIEQVGLERVIEQVGLKRIIEHAGPGRVIKLLEDREVIHQMGLDRLLAGLSPAERRELKRRLQ